MKSLKDFIELTCLDDGMRAAVRTDTILRVFDVGESMDDGASRPAHVQISFNDGSILRVQDKYESVLNKIWESEL